jgi:hypothetical protein
MKIYVVFDRNQGTDNSGNYIQEEPLSYHKTELGAEMRISEYMIADIKNYKSSIETMNKNGVREATIKLYEDYIVMSRRNKIFLKEGAWTEGKEYDRYFIKEITLED